MDEKLFKELLESVREAGRASRSFKRLTERTMTKEARERAYKRTHEMLKDA